MRMNQLVWFKRDLRVSDHAALVGGAERGPCVCLYIYEPSIMSGDDFDASHLVFINESLAVLDDALRSLGSCLITKVGSAVEVISALHNEYDFECIHSHEETGNDLTFQRDLALKDWTRSAGVPWCEYSQFGVIRGLKDRDGWARKWNAMMKEPIIKAPDAIRAASAPGQLILHEPTEFGLGLSGRTAAQVGGIHEAHQTLRTFLRVRGETYQQAMSSPNTAIEACSRLSTYFAYGNLSIRTAYHGLQAQRVKVRERKAQGLLKKTPWLKSLSSFDKRLHWHCHFIQKLESQPSLEWQNMATVYDGLREDEFDEARFERWCEGRTGYPMVDACMRYLHANGWINFRMRAMLVSFASYHLWLDWRPTSRYLARLFLDYEPGIHYSQFQMQSGTTGINSIRIYSPTKQVHDQDPEGRFIKAWVPELVNVPTARIAEPSLMTHDEQLAAGCIIGLDYPRPIVNHRKAVEEAKRRIYALRRQSGARDEAKAIFERHGSRRGRSTKSRQRR